MNLERSRQLQAEAEGIIPGGVDSPVRAFRAVGGNPRWIERGAGPYLFDVDGNRYLDFIGSWGALLFGHADEAVVAAIQNASHEGTSFGASSPRELALAKAIQGCYPQMERLRFVNSGTEATMSAIRVARGFTGRNLVAKFEGCYHGHADALLAEAGSGVATMGQASSAGVPPGAVADTLTLPWNDTLALRELFARAGQQLAAVIFEPIPGNMGCIPAEPGFLDELRALADEAGALLIVDEVMSGFRVARGGATERLRLRGDLFTLGKIMGGGLPCAAYGGRAEVMQCVSPVGPVYQAGTLSGNPLAMAAGLATLLRIAHDLNLYDKLEERAQQLVNGLREAAASAGVAVQVQAVGSMFTVFFSAAPVKDFAGAKRCDTAAFARFHQGMLERGVLLPPSQFEAAFVSTAHGQQQIRETITCAQAVFRQLRA